MRATLTEGRVVPQSEFAGDCLALVARRTTWRDTEVLNSNVLGSRLPGDDVEGRLFRERGRVCSPMSALAERWRRIIESRLNFVEFLG